MLPGVLSPKSPAETNNSALTVPSPSLSDSTRLPDLGSSELIRLMGGRGGKRRVEQGEQNKQTKGKLFLCEGKNWSQLWDMRIHNFKSMTESDT